MVDNHLLFIQKEISICKRNNNYKKLIIKNNVDMFLYKFVIWLFDYYLPILIGAEKSLKSISNFSFKKGDHEASFNKKLVIMITNFALYNASFINDFFIYQIVIFIIKTNIFFIIVTIINYVIKNKLN